MKKIFLDEILFELTKYHFNHCYEYKCLIKSIDFKLNNSFPYSSIPFLPVRLFKMYDLLSINKDFIFKTMMSSGTSGQAVSKIFLDKKHRLINLKL